MIFNKKNHLKKHFYVNNNITFRSLQYLALHKENMHMLIKPRAQELQLQTNRKKLSEKCTQTQKKHPQSKSHSK